MMVARSVVFPTPFLPSTASDPRSGSSRSTSSSTTVSPYPARTLARLSMSLAQVDVVHALVARDLVRRALDQHRALHQHRDAVGEAEDQLHVVLDDQDRDVRGQL